MPWTDEDRKTFQYSLKSPSTSSLTTTPFVTLGWSRLRQPTHTTTSQGNLDCCLLQYCGQSPIARYCEHQDALLRTRTCRHRETTQYSHFHLPTAHLRPSGYGPSTSSSQLHHLSATFCTPYPSQQPTPPLTRNRNDTPPIFTVQINREPRTTPHEGY